MTSPHDPARHEPADPPEPPVHPTGTATPPPPAPEERADETIPLGRSGRVHLAKRQRGIDATAVGQLLLHLPSLLVSLVIVALLSYALLPAMEWLGILLWLASGAMAFHRPTERALARRLLNLRYPTPQERARLEPLWREAAARTGIEGRAYELWIEDSDDLNALAAAGHLVGVTRFALAQLSDGQLVAVLAHELGHHVRGHAWTSLLGHWYALPGRLAWAAVRRLARIATVLGRGRIGGWTALLLLVVGGFALMALLSYWYVVLPLVVAPYLLAAVARRAELRADHHAAVSGFAPMLVEVLQMMHAEEQGGGQAAAPSLAGCGRTPVAGRRAAGRGGGQSLAGRLLSSHPDYHTRLHHLAPYLERR